MADSRSTHGSAQPPALDQIAGEARRECSLIELRDGISKGMLNSIILLATVCRHRPCEIVSPILAGEPEALLESPAS